MKRSQPRRDWSLANVKREEGSCRNCGAVLHLELAHVIGREHDKYPPIIWDEDAEPWRPYMVAPARVIPLCGPATDSTTCHGKQHGKRLDVSPLLDREESAQAVYDAGSVYSAAILLCPDLNPKRVFQQARVNTSSYSKEGS